MHYTSQGLLAVTG